MADDGATARPVVLFEACVDSLQSAVAAAAGGASRLELCASLVEGGLTPSLGPVRLIRRALPHITLHVLVRPRAGDFCYSDEDLRCIEEDVRVLAAEGVDGVVVGFLTADGCVDETALSRCIAAATSSIPDGAVALKKVAITFHRAIDVCRDPIEALRAAARCGVDYVLTSGGAATALEGAATIRALVEEAGRINAERAAAAAAGASVASTNPLVIIAGGGVTPAAAKAIVAATGVRQLHGTGAFRCHVMHSRQWFPREDRAHDGPRHIPLWCSQLMIIY